MPEKYGMQAFDGGEIMASPYISGPQLAHQVPEPVRELLRSPGVQFVVLLKEIEGRKCGQMWSVIRD